MIFSTSKGEMGNGNYLLDEKRTIKTNYKFDFYFSFQKIGISSKKKS